IKKMVLKKKNIIFSATLLSVFLVFLPALISCQNNAKSDIAALNDYKNSQESQTIQSETQSGGKEEKHLYPEDIETTINNKEEAAAEKEILKYMPNELGQVMILMYHKIGSPESEWMRTPQNFRQDLINLYENGYRLVNLLDYVNGNIDIEAGKSPVILTFDDATQGQFNFIETAGSFRLDPDCAVTILGDFCSKFPDFGKGATFYINYPYPFRQIQYIKEKLEFLVKGGYEIGNHTYSHADLSKLSYQDVAKEIALNASKTNEILPGHEVKSLALPYGLYPQNKEILIRGSFKDYSYNNEAILLIGSNPAPSPFSLDFNFLGIPRIRASEINVKNQGMYDWIDYFKKYPERRYISDGNANIVTIPLELKNKLNKNLTNSKKIFFYLP
ncbi:MAG TPA: polysaccharide deacetylase family protein, partial [Candidatus Humimicrobiaceae bacterium]